MASRISPPRCLFSIILVVAGTLAGCKGRSISGDLSCDPDPCNDRGTCEMVDGQPQCTCEEGYGGQFCETCASGYQDNDGDGECRLSCEGAALECGEYEECRDQGGEAVCVCLEGHTGPDCATCADGFQDYDGDGFCRPTCETIGYECSGHGTCEDSSGEPVCVCETGYTPDGQGNCVESNLGLSCENPIPLDLGAGTVNGNTIGAGNEYQGSCVDEPLGDELVYVFEVTEPVRVIFQTTGFDTVAYLRSECENSASEIVCNDDIRRGRIRGSHIEADLQPGTYYLFVDGFDDSGAFTLSILVDCGAGRIYDPVAHACVDDPCDPNPCDGTNLHFCVPILPGNHECRCDPGYIQDPNDPNACIVNANATGDTCADPIALTPGDGVVNGNTSGASAEGDGTCGGIGPDHVYVLTLLERARVWLQMTGYDTVLHMRTDCTSQLSQVACDDEDGPDHGAALTEILDPGVYYIFADSYSTPGTYELSYSIRFDPCADDEAVCPGAPTCEQSWDWLSYECVCPDGELVDGNACVDDPCDPNLCSDPNKNRCVADLPASYHCECNVGYMDDSGNPGTCIPDPSAKEWAILVFLNADNNLEDYGYLDLAEMEQAGSNADVDIVLLFDTFVQDQGSSRLMVVNQGSSTQVGDWTEADMASWKTLRDFGVWALANYPARHYFLILWDHGAGWKTSAPSPLFKGFSSDDTGSAGSISVSNGDYARALKAITAARGERLDIVGFDACLMQMWEVAEATAPFARYLLAAEETIPGEGWVYDGFLVPLVGDPTQTATQLGQNVIDSYADESSWNSTLSIVDLDTLDDLASAVTGFADALMANASLYADIDTARDNTQDFSYSRHRDLWHFAENVAAVSGAPASLVNAANGVITQLGLTILHNRTRGQAYNNAHGLAIYLPPYQGGMDSAYIDPDVVWGPRSTWDEFISDFSAQP